MTLEYENLNISPKIEITENDEQLSFRLNCSVLVENSKFPKKETLASSWGKILLKYGHRITGKSMNIYELFDPDNGWINSKNSLKILYGIQIDAIQKNGIWRFHFSDSFFNGKEKEHGIRVEYEEDFIIVEEEILKFHSKIFSDENSGFLGEFKDFKLLEECMQCAHGVRIDDSKISEILPIAYNLKLFNVIRYCEQKLIQQFPRGQQIPIEMVLKYRMRRYLGYLLENEKSKKVIWEFLKKMNLDELDGETMKYFVSWNNPQEEALDHWVWKSPIVGLEETQSVPSEPSSEYAPPDGWFSEDDGSSRSGGEVSENPSHKTYCISSTEAVLSLLKVCRKCGSKADMNIDHRGFNMNKVKQLFYIIDAPCFTARTYDRIKGNYVYPAVTIWYQNTKEWVWEFMRKAYEEVIRIHFFLGNKDGALNMVGDGSFDSRGRSALYLRYVLMDSKYHLALDFEIVRQKTGEKRYDMEKEGFEKSFSRLVEEASKYLEPGAVKSFTSDRSKSIATSMRLNFPQIEHNFDSWHYIRNITLDIMKTGKWFQLTNFTACEHPEIDEFDEKSAAFLDSNSKKDVKALNCLLNILKKGNRLADIGKVSPFFSTSHVESLNSRAVSYASKDRFYSSDGFTIRTMLTMIDVNERRRDELEGRRVVIREKKYYNKTSKRYSTKYVKKNPTDYRWKIGIKKTTHRLRNEERNARLRRDDSDSDQSDSESDVEDFTSHTVSTTDEDESDADSVWDQLIPVTDDDKMSDSSYEYESDLDTRASDIDSVWDHLVLMDDEGENLDDLEESEDDESYELRRDLRQ
ncbi:Protein CBG18648 [Caenorhabditis briggsae]|uniref:Protein CBG18648 n=1 Tax=Caenorhabditis briggsae TaxID=6238 RepID=A8XTT3_CAEBR|nr:Protein CBG18648 [Caenorhabditis briggsae]CAP36059.2 Protein CBG18648 [Caenorhabditis briggsae]